MEERFKEERERLQRLDIWKINLSITENELRGAFVQCCSSNFQIS